MAKVRSRTTLNPTAVKQIQNAAIQALEMTVDGSRGSILTDVMTAEVVPKQTGELERSAFVDDRNVKKGRVSIVYDTPYARRLYFHPEYNFRRDKNRNAQGLWLEEWANGGKENIVKRVFKELWRKFSGRFIQ
jgi:hypothetical protein